MQPQPPSSQPQKPGPRPCQPPGLQRAQVTSITTQLPVTRVSLYKNGVGFFEHSGRVTGDQSVTIDFTTACSFNDVLQSLTAIDLNGGRIAGAGYNSTTPLQQQLQALPLGLGEDPTAVDFYNAIRGARVEVHSGTASITGRLLNIELIENPGRDRQGPPVTEKRRLITVIGDAGEVRTMELTSSTEVRLLDADLHTDVTRYLQLLASTRNQGLRHLTLQDNGTGARELHVSYISEVPIWKSTYRILFTEPKVEQPPPNKPPPCKAGPSSTTPPARIGSTSSSPSSPARRRASSSPSLCRTIRADPRSASPRKRSSPRKPTRAAKMPQPHHPPRRWPGVATMAGMGSGSAGGVAGGSGGNYGGSLMARSANESLSVSGRDTTELLKVTPGVSYQQQAALSIAPNASTATFDDYFAYNLTEPITIRKNESALVPILQTKIDAERVTLWSPREPTPLRALWITNTSNLTLDRGSFSIVEDGNFGGEGLLDPIHPAEKRLLSYAVDQAVHVTTESQHDSMKAIELTAAKGVIMLRQNQTAEITYVVHNAATDSRTVVVEHPVRQGYTLDSDPKPEETTPTLYRFRVAAAPGETVRLPRWRAAPGHRHLPAHQLQRQPAHFHPEPDQQSRRHQAGTCAHPRCAPPRRRHAISS